ncbi:hypothetical protein E3E35_04795 [Thermococcus sp. GR7]|nr:hypothetical protein [Thermococcus sp. GR7]NJE77828.1 hypothetical protein [Thermococcus sp. GR4]NJF22956.1 hypothetical protein [Thermococcus sp. GR5]
MLPMDFALFMERYGYEILLRVMILSAFGIIAGLFAFWGYFTGGIAPLLVGVYAFLMAGMAKLYLFLFAENPRKMESENELNRERGRKFFMNRF